MALMHLSKGLLAALLVALLVTVVPAGDGRAQAKTVSADSAPIYICTDSKCALSGDETPDATAHDNVFTLDFPAPTDGSDNVVTLHNLDLPRTSAGTPDANPKTVTLSGTTATIVAVLRSTGLVDSGSTYQIKAFHGNRIEISHTPGGGQFATIKTVTVDNIQPTLLSTSPEAPLIVNKNVDITFSADVTDAGSGFTTVNTSTAGIHTQSGRPGVLEQFETDANGDIVTVNGVNKPGNGTTNRGGIRLVVAGNVVDLGMENFERIDGGWRVTKTINSSAIQNISARVPWYFEVKDRAGNVRRSDGSITGGVLGTSTSPTTLRFRGNLSGDADLQDGNDRHAFLGSRMRVTWEARGSGGSVDNTFVSNPARILNFDGATGTFTVENTEDAPLFDGPCPIGDETTSPTCDDVPTILRNTDTNPTTIIYSYTVRYEILGSNLIIVDSEPPVLTTLEVRPGRGYDFATQRVSETEQKNSIQIILRDPAKEPRDLQGGGMDVSTITSDAFSVSGHSIASYSSARKRRLPDLGRRPGLQRKTDVHNCGWSGQRQGRQCH